MSRPSAVAHQSESTSDNVSPPSDMDVRAALEQIAQSSQFRSSPRLVAFLRYVVERTLAGRCAEIKSYTIAVDALHRDPSFDPQADPIVRVEAGRLRHALALYYASGGRSDPVLIGLPRGSYVPDFRLRGFTPEGRTDDRAALQALFHRLSELHRQLKVVTVEIEIAWGIRERSDQLRQRRA